jgi:hypothetical protein
MSDRRFIKVRFKTDQKRFALPSIFEDFSLVYFAPYPLTNENLKNTKQLLKLFSF